MTRSLSVYDHNFLPKQWIFYICLALVVANALLLVTAADGEEEETGTKAPSSGGSGSGKKTYKSAYHHVRPGHSVYKYPGSSDSSGDGLSWVKLLVIVILVLCAILFIVVVCAYWGRNAGEEAMTERQAAVTRFLKMSQDQQA